jgi:hypothetical protein
MKTRPLSPLAGEAAAQGGFRSDAGQAHSAGGRPGKLLGPPRRRACIEQVRAQLHVSERRACAALGQHRSTQRKLPRGREDEERLTADIIELARQYGFVPAFAAWPAALGPPAPPATLAQRPTLN